MYDGTEEDLLRLLASRAGISHDYYDIAGTLHVTSDDTRRAILTAMGFDTASRESLAQVLIDWDEAPWRQPCDPILILERGYGPTGWAFRLSLEEAEEEQLVLTWHLSDEKGTIVHREDAGPRLVPREVHTVDGRRMVRLELPLVPYLELGYYDLAVVGTVGTKATKGFFASLWLPHIVMCHRGWRKGSGCGDSRCSSMRCDPGPIGASATLPIWPAWLNGPARHWARVSSG